MRKLICMGLGFSSENLYGSERKVLVLLAGRKAPEDVNMILFEVEG